MSLCEAFSRHSINPNILYPRPRDRSSRRGGQLQPPYSAYTISSVCSGVGVSMLSREPLIAAIFWHIGLKLRHKTGTLGSPKAERSIGTRVVLGRRLTRLVYSRALLELECLVGLSSAKSCELFSSRIFASAHSVQQFY